MAITIKTSEPAQDAADSQPRFSWLNAAAKDLLEINARCGWSLDENELKAIQTYFRPLRREPTRGEIETIAQTWSEHCKHKTFTSPIRYSHGKEKRLFKNLLAETVMEATRKLRKPWCLSVFKDNAGVVAFDKKWAIAFKVETHNHPCAIEPYGGAETGVGGVIRDILGVGLGAKPILNTDVFCFCPPDYAGDLPAGVLHPRRTLTSVVAGVRDYGNRMGIPTAAGAIFFDEEYRFNPLVFVGTLGLMPSWAVDKEIAPGDLIVAVGGRTGKDGLHGATFSSANIDQQSSSSAVQIGHAIMEKRVLDALLAARDRKLYRAVTDCGAGGFSSAIGEMAKDVSGARGGARVRLEEALLKVSDMASWEIWVSESQERMVLAVPPKNLPALTEVFSNEGVESRVLGEFTQTGKLEVAHKGSPLVDLDLRFLHDGLPRRERVALWEDQSDRALPAGRKYSLPAGTGRAISRPVSRGSAASGRCGDAASSSALAPGAIPSAGEISAALHWMLGHLNVCSREWVIRQYDHEVQGGTVIKPLQGLHHDGPGDACVIWPMAATGDPQSYRGIAAAHGINPAYGKIDPYAMALACADEALNNLVCVGADITMAAFLDNFCWGDPDDPRALGGLVRAALGCHDAALGFEVPFISGKDSFYNEFTAPDGERHPVPGTLLISALAPVPDVRKAVTMDLKAPGNPVYLVGWTSDETGGSLWAQRAGKPLGAVPMVEPRSARDALRSLSAAMLKGLVLTAHNLSEGGLAVAAAEMAFSGEIGVHLDLDEINRTKEVEDDATILFSESPSRFLLEVDPKSEKAFLKAMKGVPLSRVGTTIANPILRVVGLDGTLLLEECLHRLKSVWQSALPERLAGRKA